MNRLFWYCLLAVAVPAAAFAQGPGQGPGPEGKSMERLEQIRKVRLIETLDLKEDQSVRFFARLNDHDKVRRELREKKGEALDKIERLMRNRASDQEYETLFAEAAAVDQQLAEEGRRFFDSLKDLLSMEQRAKLLLFERRFERDLREAMREVRQRRMGNN